jgi:hypothetical protein
MSPAAWRRWGARRRAARARWERRQAMAFTAELILAAEDFAINLAIADLERQIQATQADTE